MFNLLILNPNHNHYNLTKVLLFLQPTYTQDSGYRLPSLALALFTHKDKTNAETDHIFKTKTHVEVQKMNRLFLLYNDSHYLSGVTYIMLHKFTLKCHTSCVTLSWFCVFVCVCVEGGILICVTRMLHLKQVLSLLERDVGDNFATVG